MSRLNVSNLFNENEDGAPVVSGISTFSSPNYFVPPSGSTAQRPSSPGEGMIRFNTDSGHLEYYTGTHWADVITNNNELGNQTLASDRSAQGTGTRGLIFGGGYSAASPRVNHDIIDYISLSTFGNAQDFGDISSATNTHACCASATRGLVAGGNGLSGGIQFVTIASTGDTSTFGALNGGGNSHFNGCASSTRGIFAGGWAPAKDEIEYITIASTGNGVDFGNLTVARIGLGALSSQVRAVFGAGSIPATNTVDYITISSTGNAQDFGDLNYSQLSTGISNSTRGLFYQADGGANIIDFITIASTGNAQDFGDQTISNRYVTAGMASATRAAHAGGNNDTVGDTIDCVEIASTGNAVDFGNLTQGRFRTAGCSNGHGGL